MKNISEFNDADDCVLLMNIVINNGFSLVAMMAVMTFHLHFAGIHYGHGKS